MPNTSPSDAKSAARLQTVALVLALKTSSEMSEHAECPVQEASLERSFRG